MRTIIMAIFTNRYRKSIISTYPSPKTVEKYNVKLIIGNSSFGENNNGDTEIHRVGTEILGGKEIFCGVVSNGNNGFRV